VRSNTGGKEKGMMVEELETIAFFETHEVSSGPTVLT
jgi:hypothetical protein